VLETNGNNMEELLATIAMAKSKTGNGKPVVILMRTVMGMGVDL